MASKYEIEKFTYPWHRLFKILDIEMAMVLCQLITEYNFAKINNFLIEDCFLTDISKMTDYIGYSWGEIIDVLEALREWHFIDFVCSRFDDIYKISIDENMVIRFIENDITKNDLYENMTITQNKKSVTKLEK